MSVSVNAVHAPKDVKTDAQFADLALVRLTAVSSCYLGIDVHAGADMVKQRHNSFIIITSRQQLLLLLVMGRFVLVDREWGHDERDGGVQ